MQRFWGIQGMQDTQPSARSPIESYQVQIITTPSFFPFYGWPCWETHDRLAPQGPVTDEWPREDVNQVQNYF